MQFFRSRSEFSPSRISERNPIMLIAMAAVASLAGARCAAV